MKSQHRWLERGQGEPVVLLHGLMGQMHHWDDVLDELGGACRAMAPTLPIFDPGCLEPSIDLWPVGSSTSSTRSRFPAP